MRARDPRAEAGQVAGDGFDVRVLEPSPPAVEDGPWFADDPVARGEPPSGRRIVSPVRTGDLTWQDWLARHPARSSWAAERWLAAYRPLGPVPPELGRTRVALHRLAAYVLSPARRRVNGKMALRWTLGGFGTPFFGADEQVRVLGTRLVRQARGRAVGERITSLARAATLVLDGPPDVAWAEEFDIPPAGDPDEELPVDADAAAFLGDWYGFGWSVLEELRADPASAEASRVQLWPEHFDAAFECLPGERRLTFGASPGDTAIAEPYLYVVGAGVEAVASPRWNATAFRGAVLLFGELDGAVDQRAVALDFFRACRAVVDR